MRRMEMSKNFFPLDADQPGLSAATERSSRTIYLDPDDVLSDPELTVTQKREVLASWISDACAIENAPAFRRLESGAVVEVDAILRAMKSLDGAPLNELRHRTSPLIPFKRRLTSRWLNRARPSKKGDDDDDPPPAPAGLAVPFRPVFVTAIARPALSGRA